MKSKLQPATKPAKRYKSKLYDLKLGGKCYLNAYDYGVSHISKKLKRKFIQRKTEKGFVAMRVR